MDQPTTSDQTIDISAQEPGKLPDSLLIPPQEPTSGQASIPPPDNQPPQSRPKVNRPMVILTCAIVLMGILAGLVLLNAGVFRNTTLRMGQSMKVEPSPFGKFQVKHLVVGTDATYPPMESFDRNGDLTGFDIDLISEIGNELGAKVELRNYSFDKIFSALDEKEISLIISSVTITDERKQKYNFSEPYINAGQVIVITSNSATLRLTPQDLKGKRVGVQKGTTSESEAQKFAGNALVAGYADYSQAVAALNAKKVDAIIVDLTAAKGLVDKYQNLRIASDPFTNEYYGIVFRKEDIKLKEAVDKVILSLQKRGVLNNIRQKWFQ